MDSQQLGYGDPPPDLATPSPPLLIVHLLEVKEDYAIYFHASNPSPFVARHFNLPDTFTPGQLYSLQASCERDVIFKELPERARRAFTSRQQFSFTSAEDLRRTVIGGVLLQQRLVDYTESAAIIVTVSPLVISVPKRMQFGKRGIFCTESGDALDVHVDNVFRGRSRAILYCTMAYPLPGSLQAGSRLVYSDNKYASVVTRSLEPYYRGHRSLPNLDLLERLYGEFASYAYPKVDPTLFTVLGTNNVFNGELSEIMRRYSSSCPAFVVENQQEDAETMRWLLPAFAACCPGDGIPHFIAKHNDTLLDLAFDFADADECYGLDILHLISCDKEATLEDAHRSPYSYFNEWNEDGNPHVGDFNRLREEFLAAGKRKRRVIQRRIRRKFDAAWKQHNDKDYDAVLSTMETAFGWLLKDPDGTGPVRQLRRVNRVIVLDAHLWKEAELLALILHFKNQSHRGLQFVFIEDLKKPPDFHTCNKSSLPSEFAPSSLLQVLKRKQNIPVIKIRQPFIPPALPPVIPAASLYSDLQPPHHRAKLTTIDHGVIDQETIKMATRFGGLVGTASVVSPLELVLHALKECGMEQRSGTVIAYEETFRSIEQTSNSIDYDLVAMEYPDRDNDLIVMLWTTDSRGISVKKHAFFAYPFNANEAVRRHKAALTIVDRIYPCNHEHQSSDLAVVTHGMAPGNPSRSDRVAHDPTAKVGRYES